MIYSNRIRNEEIYLTIWVTFIDEKINKSYLRQFGYVQRTVVNAPVKMSKLIQVQKTKQKKNHKKNCESNKTRLQVEQKGGNEYMRPILTNLLRIK